MLSREHGTFPTRRYQVTSMALAEWAAARKAVVLPIGNLIVISAGGSLMHSRQAAVLSTQRRLSTARRKSLDRNLILARCRSSNGREITRLDNAIGIRRRPIGTCISWLRSR